MGRTSKINIIIMQEMTFPFINPVVIAFHLFTLQIFFRPNLGRRKTQCGFSKRLVENGRRRHLLRRRSPQRLSRLQRLRELRWRGCDQRRGRWLRTLRNSRYLNRVFSELNSVESIEFVANYFLVLRKMKITKK